MNNILIKKGMRVGDEATPIVVSPTAEDVEAALKFTGFANPSLKPISLSEVGTVQYPVLEKWALPDPLSHAHRVDSQILSTYSPGLVTEGSSVSELTDSFHLSVGSDFLACGLLADELAELEAKYT